MTKEIDFKLIVGKAASKTFVFTNDDGTDYDFGIGTVKLKLYLEGSGEDPIEIDGGITDNKVVFAFTVIHTANKGNFEYVIEETKEDTSLVQLVKGNLLVIAEVPFTTSIEAFLVTELPASITLDENYKQQRIIFWKIFLMGAARIAEANIYTEISWTILYRMLIAKLVAYDALELAAKGSYFQFMGGSHTDPNEISGGPVKKIETGPSSVEFHDTVNALDKIFSTSSGGFSAWENIQVNLCGLANKIGVKIPMCISDTIIFVPSKSSNPDWEIITLSDIEDNIIVSTG